MLDNIRCKDSFHLDQQRAGPADRDAEVVKKLGVEVTPQAWLIGPQDLKQCEVNLSGPRDRGDGGGETHSRQRNVVSDRSANLPKDRDDGILGTRLQTGSALDHRLEPRV